MSNQPIEREKFSERLRQSMKEKKLTQLRLAKIMEVTQPTVSFWLKEGVPSPSMRILLAQRLDVSFSWLFYGQGPKTGEFTKHLKRIDAAVAVYEPILEHFENLVREEEGRIGEHRAKIQEVREAFRSAIASSESQKGGRKKK